MARKTKEEAQHTRSLLLEAAERLFSERGVANTTLNDIATAAGLTRGAIYWHFQNKTDLIHALWDQVALPLHESFAELALSMPDDPLARIQVKSTTVLTQVVRDVRIRNLLSILLLKCEYVEEPGGLREGYLIKRADCLGEITEEFRLAVMQGQLPAGLDERFAAIGLMALIDGLCFHWLMNPTLFSLENKAKNYIDAYLKGLSAAI
ncbi:MAG: TetR family transcriptional regulator [Methylophilaceae bacterium]|nr:TetR family transcriptional regulator [Methylophilaceae bacterium]